MAPDASYKDKDNYIQMYVINDSQDVCFVILNRVVYCKNEIEVFIITFFKDSKLITSNMVRRHCHPVFHV